MESNKTMDDLTAIRAIMEKSTRFLSLSGLSGIFSGIAALAGTIAAICVQNGSSSSAYLNTTDDASFRTVRNALAADAVFVLVIALTAAIYFSFRKARKKGLKVWTPVSKNLLLSMIVPLLTGGLFILYLVSSHNFEFIVPAMLIFYGLALVNAWKYTFNEILYLGLLDIASGLIALILPEYGLFLWGFGFGILHIAYGIIMYRKYEK